MNKFQYMNEPPQSERYKWFAVCEFQQAFDIDAVDFAAMLKKAKQATYNIIDSYNQPFGGLVKLSEKAPETVREMFRLLYVDDGGDLTVRQAKITAFLKNCDELVNKYYPGSFLYKNDQRSAMAYLFFYDPDNHYLYKATEATYLADCVGFYDDWGAMSAFKLDIYHRFCDELISEIRETPEMLETHESRFKGAQKPFYPDSALHILVFDIIYCAHTYGLYSGLSFDKVTTAERKTYQENKTKAQQLLVAVQNAENDVVQLHDAQHYFEGLLANKASVSHKMLGTLEVVSLTDGFLSVRVLRSGELKKFQLLSSIANGFILITAPDFADKVSEYKAVMLRERDIPVRIESAQKALLPYAKYLD
ncbi:MAG: hypothetical protein IJD81_05885 [Oscillospiraceae bacterium]|nr:hypothetical protein [Oscillospiraceae bacterium]